MFLFEIKHTVRQKSVNTNETEIVYQYVLESEVHAIERLFVYQST